MTSQYDTVQFAVETLQPSTLQAPSPVTTLSLVGSSLPSAGLNVRMMHLLERLAGQFFENETPLLVLGGAALNLMLPKLAPDRCPVEDLHLLIKPRFLSRARGILESMGGLRCDVSEREDLLPRFRGDTEYTVGSIRPVRVVLHVWAVRSFRFAKLLPEDAFWRDSELVRVGDAVVHVPGREEMLVDLALAESLGRGDEESRRRHISLWLDEHGSAMDWDRFLSLVENWRLAQPVGEGLRESGGSEHPTCSPDLLDRIARLRAGWRDRLATWHARSHRQGQWTDAALDALCAPSVRLSLARLRSAVFPGRDAVRELYYPRHPGWLVVAHMMRWADPIVRRLRPLASRICKAETRESAIHGVGLFATRSVRAGEGILHYRAKSATGASRYVIDMVDTQGRMAGFELTGMLRAINHSCRANTVLNSFGLVARRAIRAGQELTVDYGKRGCGCPREQDRSADVATDTRVASVA